MRMTHSPTIASDYLAIHSCMNSSAASRLSVPRLGRKLHRKPGRGKQTKDFFMRLNNGTRSLDIEEAVVYISAHDWAGG